MPNRSKYHTCNNIGKPEYHPTTAKGVSELTSKHTEETLGYRTGQCAKDSPGKWTLTDNNIITCYNKMSDWTAYEGSNGNNTK
eukprot:8098058-Ditylum_brightwellii.AAC.1